MRIEFEIKPNQKEEKGRKEIKNNKDILSSHYLFNFISDVQN